MAPLFDAVKLSHAPTRPVILFVEQFSELSGAQRVLLDLLPAIEQHYTPVVALPGAGPLATELERRGVRSEPLALGRYTAGTKSASDLLRYALQQPGLVKRVSELAGATGAALIYANGPRVFPATALAARRLRLPLVWHLHLELPSARDRRLLAAVARLARPLVIACSRDCLAAFSPRSALRRRAEVVYNGVAPVDLAPGAPASGATPVIGTIGRFHPDKGQADLLGAAPEILEVFPQARFRLVGPVADEPYSRRLSKQASKLGAGRVEFVGVAPSPATALAGLDLLVVPSHRESLGRVILEAFSAGVPVIASDAGGITEVIEPDENGMLFPRGDTGALARAAIRVLGDAALRERLIRGARESYRRRWGLERFQREMLERIARQIAPRPPRRSPPA